MKHTGHLYDQSKSLYRSIEAKMEIGISECVRHPNY